MAVRVAGVPARRATGGATRILALAAVAYAPDAGPGRGAESRRNWGWNGRLYTLEAPIALRLTHGAGDRSSGRLRSPIRPKIPCFDAGGQLILTFGVRKKSNKLPTKDIRRAHSMKREFQQGEDR